MPFNFKLNSAYALYYLSYFARDDVFVGAVFIRKYDAGGVLQEAHVHAVVSACTVVWLI
jgi:hypothetical protein